MIVNMADGRKVGPPQSQLPSYTLAELTALAREWLGVPKDDDMPERLSISNFLVYLAKREKEVGDGN